MEDTYTLNGQTIRWSTSTDLDNPRLKRDELQIGDVRFTVIREPFSEPGDTTVIESTGLIRTELGEHHPWNASARALLTTMMNLVHFRVARVSDTALHETVSKTLADLRRRYLNVDAGYSPKQAVLAVSVGDVSTLAEAEQLTDAELSRVIAKMQDVFTAYHPGPKSPEDLLGALIDSEIKDKVFGLGRFDAPTPRA